MPLTSRILKSTLRRRDEGRLGKKQSISCRATLVGHKPESIQACRLPDSHGCPPCPCRFGHLRRALWWGWLGNSEAKASRQGDGETNETVPDAGPDTGTTTSVQVAMTLPAAASTVAAPPYLPPALFSLQVSPMSTSPLSAACRPIRSCAAAPLPSR